MNELWAITDPLPGTFSAPAANLSARLARGRERLDEVIVEWERFARERLVTLGVAAGD